MLSFICSLKAVHPSVILAQFLFPCFLLAVNLIYKEKKMMQYVSFFKLSSVVRVGNLREL